MEFSIESSLEKIKHKNTKLYFKEVQSSYTLGNYRSAIVMLYSVVICDLVYKLQELSDLYNDNSAKKLIGEIEKKQRSNYKSPEWEKYLIEEVHKRTELLEIFDYQNILNLQKHRNLSAHPVMGSNYVLYSPNKETTRAHIRNILEGLLIKPAILSRKVIDKLIDDLVEKKNVLLDEEQIARYLNAKYFNNMQLEVKKIYSRIYGKQYLI